MQKTGQRLGLRNVRLGSLSLFSEYVQIVYKYSPLAGQKYSDFHWSDIAIATWSLQHRWPKV